MKNMRDAAMIAAGIAMTLAYQKYKEPVKDAMTKAFNETKQKANKALEDMM